MQEMPYLGDFYDKSKIPVGHADKVKLMRLNQSDGIVYNHVSHWLIALIWLEAGWKVVVYPVCRSKPFWCRSAYFESEETYKLDIALKVSRVLETHSLNDCLTSRRLYHELRQVTGEEAHLA
ncbi:hypothetical protein IC620_11090 [Hazenella sp. IB182357]|uniref:Uncharacterized protein n=1 Tax=Polycladospora coralii TaxID=2771432 RepID=A0A926RXV8_9BACL|nr:hypothetical protein [Polycladospora coralii]MBD1372901.1 hypothetical protein [Polycladospora coralii]MBS7529405.1 hypothetical protein [Polycladospora coralii]